MAKIRRNNAFAVIISVVVIALLILAGPAQGFTLALGLDNNNPTKGDPVSFTVELDIEAGEQLPIDLITMNINGPKNLACQFDALGNKVVGCDGMTITRVSYPTYSYGYGYGYNPGTFGYGYFGYGYGYGPGKLIYEVTLDTSGLQTGSYTTNFQVKIGNKNIAQNGPVFVVKTQSNNDDDDDDDDDGPNGSCVTSYICTSWSACENGVQTRSCTKDVQYCYAGDYPEITRSCQDGSNFDALSGDNEGTIQLTNTSSSTENASTLTSRITGAVTGLGNTEEFNEDSLLFLVAIMVLVLATLTLLLLIRRAMIAKAARSKSFY